VNAILVIAANRGRARFFGAEPDPSEPQRLRLVERDELDNPDVRRPEGASGKTRTDTNTNRQAGPVHPIVARRARHEFELGRRFAQQIERRVAEHTRGWHVGTVVLVAEPQLLGLLRGGLRAALDPGVALKELAKDYTQLTVSELRDRLALDRLIPAKEISPQ